MDSTEDILLSKGTHRKDMGLLRATHRKDMVHLRVTPQLSLTATHLLDILLLVTLVPTDLVPTDLVPTVHLVVSGVWWLELQHWQVPTVFTKPALVHTVNPVPMV